MNLEVISFSKRTFTDYGETLHFEAKKGHKNYEATFYTSKKRELTHLRLYDKDFLSTKVIHQEEAIDIFKVFLKKERVRLVLKGISIEAYLKTN